jgi:hypothetical protein
VRTIGQTRVTRAFVSATEAGEEILKIPPSNVAKILANNGVEFQTLVVGKRPMKVFLRDDVERVARERAAKVKSRKAKA